MATASRGMASSREATRAGTLAIYGLRRAAGKGASILPPKIFILRARQASAFRQFVDELGYLRIRPQIALRFEIAC